MLAIQLILSFFLGGVSVAILSVVAENTNERVSGIVMMLPTTIVIGFGCLAWTTSAAVVAEVAPATIVPLGLLVFSIAIYVCTSRFFETRIKHQSIRIGLALVVSVILWLLTAIPLAAFPITKIELAIPVYAVFVLLTTRLLRSPRFEAKQCAQPAVSGSQIFCRAMFVGLMISMVVLLGKTVGPYFGGVFIMFPAATFSALAIFHRQYNAAEIASIMRNAPVGSLALLTYTLVVIAFFPRVGFFVGSLVAFVGSLLVSLVVATVLPKLLAYSDSRRVPD